MKEQISIWTVGHSTLAIEDFIGLLDAFEIQVLVDVRSFPGSRRFPQFNKESLQSSLTAAGIEYVHLPELGGRRRARPDSINMAWRNESFRGYADYMETAGFELGISKLLDLAPHRRTAIMCAESLWWRCHRSLISDCLKVNGSEVIHIVGGGKSEPHPYTTAARIVDGRLSYRGVLES
jgi:uncharacterized protein (DUF488 family)